MYNIFKSLLPKGKLFRIPQGGNIEKLYKAITKESDRIKDFLFKVNSAVVPNTDMHTETVDDWGNTLAIGGTATSDKVIGKFFSFGGQGVDYIQNVLQKSGYTQLYVYENIPEYNPAAGQLISTLGDFQLGDLTLGAYSDRLDPRPLSGTVIAGSHRWETFVGYEFCQLSDYQLGDFQLGDYETALSRKIDYEIPNNSDQFVKVWFIAGVGGMNDLVTLTDDEIEDIERIVIDIKPAHTWAILRHT
jgi:hypothetical protein